MMLVEENGSEELKCVCVRENISNEPSHKLFPSVLPPVGKRGDIEVVGGCKVCKCVLDSSKDPSICSQGCMRKRNGHPYCHCSIRRSFSPSKCPVHCPYGYKKDARGCSTCDCKPSNDVLPKSECPVFDCHTGHCEGGFKVDANGCNTCECKSIDYDSALERMCPELINCDPSCERGLDQNGCPTCICKSNDVICPKTVCKLNCFYGYLKDSNGCITCTCIPRPILLDSRKAAGTTRR